jgi:hypothetical protein
MPLHSIAKGFEPSPRRRRVDKSGGVNDLSRLVVDERPASRAEEVELRQG